MLYVFVDLPAVDAPPLVLDDTDRERLMMQMQRFCCPCHPPYRSSCAFRREGLRTMVGPGPPRRTQTCWCLARVDDQSSSILGVKR